MTIDILMLLLILIAISSVGGQEADVIGETNSGQELALGVRSSDLEGSLLVQSEDQPVSPVDN